jgi:hypothetical protein
VEEREVRVQGFDSPRERWGLRSDVPVASQSASRPNEFVAEATLSGFLPREGADVLFHFQPIDPVAPRAQISGVSFLVRASPDLRCEDAAAHLRVVLQSEADHWIPLDPIPLSSLLGVWRTVRVRLQEPRHLEAMSKLYAVRLQLVSTRPVTGTLQLDDFGFLVRSLQ